MFKIKGDKTIVAPCNFITSFYFKTSEIHKHHEIILLLCEQVLEMGK